MPQNWRLSLIAAQPFSHIRNGYWYLPFWERSWLCLNDVILWFMVERGMTLLWRSSELWKDCLWGLWLMDSNSLLVFRVRIGICSAMCLILSLLTFWSCESLDHYFFLLVFLSHKRFELPTCNTVCVNCGCVLLIFWSHYLSLFTSFTSGIWVSVFVCDIFLALFLPHTWHSIS